MFARFFVNRPVFATVLSVLIVLAGFLAMKALPIAEFPDIVPPEVEVSASYPGASAEVIAQTVAAPLEQQVNGVQDMLYMRSVSAGDGSLTLSVTFAVGTDPDQNTINVNNRVQAALTSLPEEVRRQGVTVSKKSSNMLQVLSVFSPDGLYDTVYISNYALVNIIDDLKRLPGVGDAVVFGAQDYSIRIWIRPDRLAQLGLTPSDIASAVREQNAQFAAGAIGKDPLSSPVELSYTVTTQGRMTNPEEFGEIILRANPDGTILRLKDVARLELGAQTYSLRAKNNGKPSVALGIYLSPGANALETAEIVSNKMAELSQRFPDGIEYSIPYDTTTFVRISVDEVVKTLIEAFVLVFAIIYLFLQNWRATLIPCLAVPVSIIGTFAGMYLLGFSINTLTLFGLVLAIGIVVDDAIVVLENVERIMSTEKLPPKEATIKAMHEVTGPVVAIVLVLCAVFVPVAFMGGLAGEMYKQFAVTIAVSVTISGIVALTLTPALCALMLKEDHSQPLAPFRWFNRFFDSITARYTDGVRVLLKRSSITIALFCVVIGITWNVFQKVPGQLVPNEDKGTLIAMAMLPDGSSLSRTDAITDDLVGRVLSTEGVRGTISLAGLDLFSGSMKSNMSTTFITLDDWKKRSEENSSFNIVKGIFRDTYSIVDAFVLAFNMPPISGMSNTGGFEAFLQSRSGAGVRDLAEKAQLVVKAAASRPELANVTSNFSVNAPQLDIRLDREKAKSMGVPVSRVFETMQATFGAYYINDFNKLGRTFKVLIQSESDYRRTPEDISNVYVRSNNGKMIPLTALVTVKQVTGPEVVERFNVFPAAKILGGPAPGYSSSQALQAMEEIVKETLPAEYTLAWTGSAYQEKTTGGTSVQVFVLGLVMVFLILAAQYEKWSLPLAVIMAVPFALFGAILANFSRGLANDVYFQIALVTLVGLSSKNAILIVEFASMLHKEGMSAYDAAVEAAKLRFRPIVMTSLAFILGVVPLAISSGAGAASRHSIGTGIIGGMLASTFIATLFIPSFYRAIIAFTEKALKKDNK
ncbi:efflux RND transporter permease subunit [Halodesulfovibrio marinisediminis]|uniref:Multidrug efflux pump n=1 Tax=Halodesulfovibrio marinisediminis DSM 17456 TaxID=1121457 RepID=A0A1N6HDI7_9BACT|nr:efflux RND transporter permease subunit [Halodesulfovibrio marinisediminis]SIO17715.1 multidrug efflux pump [Halodesulfovibrio marinisediminis DSM 17456]